MLSFYPHDDESKTNLHAFLNELTDRRTFASSPSALPLFSRPRNHLPCPAESLFASLVASRVSGNRANATMEHGADSAAARRMARVASHLRPPISQARTHNPHPSLCFATAISAQIWSERDPAQRASASSSPD